MLAAPASRWWRRPSAVLLAGGVALTVLAACDKPTPQVTFATGSHSVIVTPSRYCFTLDRSSCRADSTHPPRLDAQPGSAILISVPRSVADNAWVATAYTTSTSGKATPIDGAGSNLVVDNHTARVFVPLQVGSYLLSVTEVRKNVQTGTWTLQVSIRA